jgi:hypothetical protein
VGIGTSNPQALFHVANGGSTNLDWIGMLNNPGNSSGTGYGVGLRLQNSTPASGGNEVNKWAGIAAVAGVQYSNQTDMALYTGNFVSSQNATYPPTERVRIQGVTGNVGIGTTSPAHLLHVAGTIGAEEVIVSSTGADYVFQPDYRLQPLTEVKKYIEEHRHLPEIPSAAEVSKKGMSLGDMQSKLLAKVEELTLHMIRAEEENRELRERLARLESVSSKK